MESRLDELGHDECMALVAGENYGRLVVVIDGYPVALPMQFALDGERVVLRTNPGSKFNSAPLTHVSFEVDHIDGSRHEGWSVVIEGVAEDITHGIDALSEHARALGLASWAPGPTDRWLAVVPHKVTGRRLFAS